jgi:hypothetical protein
MVIERVNLSRTDIEEAIAGCIEIGLRDGNLPFDELWLVMRLCGYAFLLRDLGVGGSIASSEVQTMISKLLKPLWVTRNAFPNRIYSRLPIVLMTQIVYGILLPSFIYRLINLIHSSLL